MTLEQLLLDQLIEECAEVIQRASKCSRFGMLEVQSGQNLSNTTRLIEEWVDLHAVWELLHDYGFIHRINLDNRTFRRMIKAKKRKVQKYMAYSVIMGRLNNPEGNRNNENKKQRPRKKLPRIIRHRGFKRDSTPRAR